MQRSFKSRLAALEALEAQTRTRPIWDRLYYLPESAYPACLVRTFRARWLEVVNGRIAVPDRGHWTGAWQCHWIADALNEHRGWGDVFLTEAEIADARDLADHGGLVYAPAQGPVNPQPAGWRMEIGEQRESELYMHERWRYFAVHDTERHVRTAAPIAALRLGEPIVTVDALRAWLAAARPLTVSPDLADAIAPIVVSAGVAQSYGCDPGMLEEIDYDEVG